VGKINFREANISLLSKRGFVYEHLDDLGQQAVENAQTNVEVILGDRLPGGVIEGILNSIDYEIIQRGFILALRVGIIDTGKATRFLARKEDKEGSVIFAAIAEALD